MNTTSSHITGLLSTGEVVAPPPGVAEWFPHADQDAFVAQALRDPLAFWRERADQIVWSTQPQTVFTGAIDDQHWFPDGEAERDRLVPGPARRAASRRGRVRVRLRERRGDHVHVRRAAGAREPARERAPRRRRRRGDRVCIYMPLTIEGIVAMLACARIGAIHSVVYAGSARRRCATASSTRARQS